MKEIHLWLILVTLLASCSGKEQSHGYTSVDVKTVFEDSVSIRAIEFLDGNTLAFAGSNGMYGSVDVSSGKVRTNILKYHTGIPQFRAVGHTATDFFMLSIANPALLYKTGESGRMQLVYKEEGDGVFYDAMAFWNDQEGIAVGDSQNGCLSIIITRDAGQTWKKLDCDNIPRSVGAEGAFAASNTNIKIVGDHAWIATTAGRILKSEDRGMTWSVVQTPITHQAATAGIYSIDFYNEQVGFGIGGDYTRPEDHIANKISTQDGGLTWQLAAENQPPGYKSCVQYVPHAGGNDLVSVGFTGISYSSNGGESWKELSKEGFYTLRFLNDSVAYAAGRNRIAILTFK